MKAKFVVGTAVIRQALLWLGSFLNHLSFIEPNNKPITIYCEYGSVSLHKGSKISWKTKHIKIKYTFIQDAIEENEAHIEYIPLGQMIVDPLIKPKPPSLFTKHVRQMGRRRL